MSYDVANPVLGKYQDLSPPSKLRLLFLLFFMCPVEARPDPSGHLALYLPAPLLTRLKAELSVSLVFKIFYLFMFLFFLESSPRGATCSAELNPHLGATGTSV